MIYFGCDPDMGGGLCAVEGSSVVCAARMPVRAEGGERQIDYPEVWRLMDAVAARGPVVAAVERAIVRRQAGGSMTGGIAKTHHNRGGLYVSALQRFDAVIEPWPSAWKREMGVSADKTDCLEEAARLHPDLSRRFRVKAEAGVAEALLLCHYARAVHARSREG